MINPLDFRVFPFIFSHIWSLPGGAVLHLHRWVSSTAWSEVTGRSGWAAACGAPYSPAKPAVCRSSNGDSAERPCGWLWVNPVQIVEICGNDNAMHLSVFSFFKCQDTRITRFHWGLWTSDFQFTINSRWLWEWSRSAGILLKQMPHRVHRAIEPKPEICQRTWAAVSIGYFGYLLIWVV